MSVYSHLSGGLLTEDSIGDYVTLLSYGLLDGFESVIPTLIGRSSFKKLLADSAFQQKNSVSSFRRIFANSSFERVDAEFNQLLQHESAFEEVVSIPQDLEILADSKFRQIFAKSRFPYVRTDSRYTKITSNSSFRKIKEGSDFDAL